MKWSQKNGFRFCDTNEKVKHGKIVKIHYFMMQTHIVL